MKTNSSRPEHMRSIKKNSKKIIRPFKINLTFCPNSYNETIFKTHFGNFKLTIGNHHLGNFPNLSTKFLNLNQPKNNPKLHHLDLTHRMSTLVGRICLWLHKSLQLKTLKGRIYSSYL